MTAAPAPQCETADERTVTQTAANNLSQTIQTDNIHDFPLDPVNIIRQINGCPETQITDSLRKDFLMTKVPPQVAQKKKSDFPVTRKRSFLVEWIKQYPSIALLMLYFVPNASYLEILKGWQYIFFYLKLKFTLQLNLTYNCHLLAQEELLLLVFTPLQDPLLQFQTLQT